jgi:exopolyphosphatase / guanosine-5'-triphosphate,3'-diphosphate pyrophosphatase
VAAKRIAVVDIGTNSTRLLVAEVEHGRVRELERRTEVTRLGEGVDDSGRLAERAIERVLSTIGDYRRAIGDLGAERIVGVATSAMREAANGEELRDALVERYGVEARTISGEEEARLTFLGATIERQGEPETLVIDIGGGSTEFVVGLPGSDPSFHVSTRLGSVRQTERHLRSDPPSPEELEDLVGEARQVIASQVPERVREDVRVGIAVAGTPTSLAAVDQRLDPYDPARVHGYGLRAQACERILATLAELPLERRREVTGLHPDRAPTIVAGAAILVQTMQAFGLDSVETSEMDLLHGAALVAAREGDLAPGGQRGIAG